MACKDSRRRETIMGVSPPLFKRSNRNHPHRSLRRSQPDLLIEAEPRPFFGHGVFERGYIPRRENALKQATRAGFRFDQNPALSKQRRLLAAGALLGFDS